MQTYIVKKALNKKKLNKTTPNASIVSRVMDSSNKSSAMNTRENSKEEDRALKAKMQKRKHMSNILRLQQLMKKGEYSSPIKELDQDRLREEFEPFLEIAKPMQHREYKVAFKNDDLKPKKLDDGNMLKRSIVGENKDFKEMQLKIQQKLEAQQLKEKKRVKRINSNTSTMSRRIPRSSLGFNKVGTEKVSGRYSSQSSALQDFKNVRFNMNNDSSMLIKSSRRTDTNAVTATVTPFGNKIQNGSSPSMLTATLAMGFQGKSLNKNMPILSLENIRPQESHR